MNYTQQQFNEMAAKLEGKTVSPAYKGGPNHNYYNDLNQLMPLAWKYCADPVAIGIKSICTNGRVNTKDEQIQAIRDCLWQIWSEGNTDAIEAIKGIDK